MDWTLRTPTITIDDISGDHSELLARDRIATHLESPYWIVPLPIGARRRLGDVIGHSATWSPDGHQLIYASGFDLYVANHDGSAPRKLLGLSDMAFDLTFSPDGHRIRFSLGNPFAGNTSMWEVGINGAGLLLYFLAGITQLGSAVVNGHRTGAISFSSAPTAREQICGHCPNMRPCCDVAHRFRYN